MANARNLQVVQYDKRSTGDPAAFHGENSEKCGFPRSGAMGSLPSGLAWSRVPPPITISSYTVSNRSMRSVSASPSRVQSWNAGSDVIAST
jgi:hypothetical protein